jgi:hypothetical protein
VSPYKNITEVFFWPLLIGIPSTLGLLSALLGDGIWDAASWALLIIPVAVAAKFSWRRK